MVTVSHRKWVISSPSIISQRLLNNTWIWKIADCWVTWRPAVQCPHFPTSCGSRSALPGACLSPAYRGKCFFQIWLNAQSQKNPVFVVVCFFFNVIISEYKFALEPCSHLMLTSPGADSDWWFCLLYIQLEVLEILSIKINIKNVRIYG